MLPTESNVSSIPLTDENFFQLVDPHRQGVCGLFKCFLHSQTDERMGYLVSSTTRSTNQLAKMQGGWEIALHMERVYKAKQLYGS